jgi:hypothetical protein
MRWSLGPPSTMGEFPLPSAPAPALAPDPGSSPCSSQFFTYDMLKRTYATSGMPPGEKRDMHPMLAVTRPSDLPLRPSHPGIWQVPFGATASIISTTVAFPFEVIRRKLQSQGFGGRPVLYDGMIDAFQKVYAKEGMGGAHPESDDWHPRPHPHPPSRRSLRRLQSQQCQGRCCGSDHFPLCGVSSLGFQARRLPRPRLIKSVCPRYCTASPQLGPKCNQTQKPVQPLPSRLPPRMHNYAAVATRPPWLREP